MSYFQTSKEHSLKYLLLILVIAALLRLLFLDSIPQGFNCDEAVTGYDSYSISETLRDRYGKFLPLFIKVMGDYRPSLYAFITIPFIKVLGLNEFATRLPAAITSILTILIVYYLVEQLFERKVALVVALLLAVNPWHIHFSRIAYEASLFPFLFCLGLLLFVKSFTQSTYLIWSAAAFGLSLNTYQSARVFVPFFLISLVFLFQRHFWRHKRETIIATLVFLIIFIPLFMFWVTPAGMARAKQVGIKTNLITVITNYISFFNPIFLFFKGTEDITMNPARIGNLYYFEFLTVLTGIFNLFREQGKAKFILWIWLFLYPIPGALVGTATPLRALVGAPLFAIISGYGIVQVLNLLKFNRKQLFWLICSFLLAPSLIIFCQRYFTGYPTEAAKLWKYGMGEAISYAEENSYNCVVMSSDVNSSCFALQDFIGHVPFYIQYPANKYQKEPIPPWIRGSRDKVYKLGKYRLMSISKQSQLNEECLYILRPEEILSVVAKGYHWKEVYTIKDASGNEHFKLIVVTRIENSSFLPGKRGG